MAATAFGVGAGFTVSGSGVQGSFCSFEFMDEGQFVADT